MLKRLTSLQVEQFHRDGFLAPIKVMSEGAAAALRAKLEQFERAHGGPLSGDRRHKTHLLFAWLSDLIREDAVLDPVEDIFGPDLLCWATNFFIKEANSPDFVSWHQDSTYWGLSKPDVLTAWVALTPSNASNGAMEVIPGTHLLDQVPHRDTFARNNLLTRGQEVMVDVDPAKAVRLDLNAGEMSLHHVRIIHGSPPNPSNDRRIGVAIRLIPTSVRQINGDDSATLVRGVDTFRTFEHEPRPYRDMEPDLVAFHKRVTERNARILYKGTQVGSYNDTAALPGVRVT